MAYILAGLGVIVLELGILYYLLRCKHTDLELIETGHVYSTFTGGQIGVYKIYECQKCKALIKKESGR